MGDQAEAPSEVRAAGAGTPEVAVVIVNYRSHQLVERATSRLGSDVAVIVVDNFSTDEERAALRSLAGVHGWTLLLSPDNRGFGAGCNRGAERAWELGCDRVVLLNPDAVIELAAVQELAAMVDDTRVVASPVIVESDGTQVFAGARLNLSDGRIRSKRVAPPPSPVGPEILTRDGSWVPWLTGACLVMHRDLWTELGGFREPYFLYWEDVDLTVRAHLAGATLMLRHDLVVTHDEGGTQGIRSGRAKSALYYDWNCRNRLRFAATTLGRPQIIRWVIATPAVSWEILMRGGRRQLIDRPTLLWAAVRGTLAGLALSVRGLVRPTAVTGH